MPENPGKQFLDLTDPNLTIRHETVGGEMHFRLELVDRIRSELQTYPLFRINDSEARVIYDWWKTWSANRNPAPEEIERILSQYATAMERPYLAPVARRVASLAEGRPAGEPLTVVELGGASAALLHWWPKNVPHVPLKYIGIEPFKPFVEHAQKLFPDARIILGDADAFLAMDAASWRPVDAFLAATVFCFIHPDVVRRCILKAAEWTDDILIRDYIVNIQGGLVPAGDNKHASFDYFRRLEMLTLFAHRFDEYFREAGFGVIHMEETRTEVDLPGWALIHARRIKT